MSRIFHRPMFRKGGSAGGITSGLRQGYANGGDLEEGQDTAIGADFETQDTVVEEKEKPGLSYADFPEIKPPEAPGFDWGSFGLNLMSGPSTGDFWSDVGEAGKEPYSRYKQGKAAYDMNKYKHKLAERQFNLEVYKALNPEDKINMQKEIDYLVETFGISEEEALNRVMPQYRKKAHPSETKLKEEQLAKEDRQRQRDILIKGDDSIKYDDQADALLDFRNDKSAWQDQGFKVDTEQEYVEGSDFIQHLVPNGAGTEYTPKSGVSLDGDYVPGYIYVDINSRRVFLWDGTKFTLQSLDVEDIEG